MALLPNPENLAQKGVHPYGRLYSQIFKIKLLGSVFHPWNDEDENVINKHLLHCATPYRVQTHTALTTAETNKTKALSLPATMSM